MRDYAELVPSLKALADATRLEIVDMLSCGEMCACDLLEHLDVTQPTLSYHMKALVSCGLVKAERRGSWVHYSLDVARFEALGDSLGRLSRPTADCVCKGSDPTGACCFSAGGEEE